jgi:O-antigen ligase
MIYVVDQPERNQLPTAVLIGCYASAVALAPSWEIKALLSAPILCAAVAWWTLSSSQRWIALFLGAALLLPPLPFALGNSGAHPAIAFAALGVFVGVARLAEWRFNFDLLTATLIAFSCVLLASAGFALWYSGGAVAAGSLVRVALFGISAYCYLYAVHGPTADGSASFTGMRWLFFAAVIAAGFACLDFYYQLPAPAGYGAQFVWLDSGVLRRAQGLFYEASTLGNFCAFFVVMVAVALFPMDGVRRLPRVDLLLGGVVLIAALMFSYSRASVLNVGVSLIALAYVRRVRLKRLGLALLACAAAGAAVVYSVFPSFAFSYWMRLSLSLQDFWSAPERVLSGRVESWRVLIGFLAEHPWHALFGIGYKTLPYSDFVGKTVIADNTYLSLLVETGIVGIAAFAALNYAILRGGLRAARSTAPTAAFFGAWIFCFWTGQMVQMFSGDLITYWRVLPLYFWVLAVAVRETR